MPCANHLKCWKLGIPPSATIVFSIPKQKKNLPQTFQRNPKRTFGRLIWYTIAPLLFTHLVQCKRLPRASKCSSFPFFLFSEFAVFGKNSDSSARTHFIWFGTFYANAMYGIEDGIRIKLTFRIHFMFTCAHTRRLIYSLSIRASSLDSPFAAILFS